MSFALELANLHERAIDLAARINELVCEIAELRSRVAPPAAGTAHPAQIKAALEMAGKTQADIARMVIGRRGHFVSSAAVHHVVRGISRSRAIAQAISDATGLPVSQLWPGTYPDLEAHERRASRPATHGRSGRKG